MLLIFTENFRIFFPSNLRAIKVLHFTVRSEDGVVLQGSHLVSSTQCPAWSDHLKEWSEIRAAAPKGQCPIRRMGENLRGSEWPDFGPENHEG